jgi:DNA recombination protein RmuC
MSIELIAAVAVAAAAALFLGCALGWLVWARPLKAARETVHNEQRERAKNATEVLMLRNQLDEKSAIEAERQRLAADLAALHARLAERDAAHARQLQQLNEQFSSLAAKALDGAQAKFLERAEARFTEQANSSQASLKAMLTPVTETMTRYESEIKKIETARTQAYAGIEATVKLVREGQESVRLEAAKLVNALRASPKARGRWGEQQLKNVLEMAGLSEHADFQTEVSVESEDGRLRPDVIVRLPGGRQLVIDAKCSMNAYLDACETTDEVARGAHLAAHARALRLHADSLGRKAYWDQFAAAADYVIMFIPGEQFLSGALEADAGLWEYAFERKVLIATPTNLVAIARTVAVVWRQEAMAHDAEKIGELARELYKRLAAMGTHIEKLGNHLNTAVSSYNNFIGSLETSVLPQGRKFLELKVEPSAKPLPLLEPLETNVRQIRRDRDLNFDAANE